MARLFFPQIVLAAAILALVAGCTPTTVGPPQSGPAATTSPAATQTPTPTVATIVLGEASNFGPSAKGFGTSEPTTIFLGGDPTGLVTSITWSSWGGATATGIGLAVNAAHSTIASVPREKATVVASDPRTCNGVLMYNQLVWYFPQEGETFAKAVTAFGSQAFISECSGN